LEPRFRDKEDRIILEQRSDTASERNSAIEHNPAFERNEYVFILLWSLHRYLPVSPGCPPRQTPPSRVMSAESFLSPRTPTSRWRMSPLMTDLVRHAVPRA
jgi:hypothetical protein